ncbi:MAG: hypothetical protein MRQ09_05600 [Candidatus Midichloria sp.]|nr:hypothetical protein [Candidatus Midichloria sp.]
MIGSSIGLFSMHYWQKYRGIDAAETHKTIAALEMERKNKVGYANSTDQIEEWYKENTKNKET